VYIWRRLLQKCLHEDSQHGLVDIREAPGVEDREEDQAESTDNSKGNGESRKDLLSDVVVLYQTALVSEPALQTESDIEHHDHNTRASNEQWFAPSSRAESRDVHDMLARVIPRVARVALCCPYTKHGNERAYTVLARAPPLITIGARNIPSHTNPATHGMNQYARPNILAARNEQV
jgi:hypothetical protein